MDGGVNDPFLAFKIIIKPLQKCVKEYGYSLAVHGSLTRDIDLVAIPWEEKCVKSDELVDAITRKVNFYFKDIKVVKCPHTKPHGRKSWAIHISEKIYIDLSVMPVRR